MPPTLAEQHAAVRAKADRDALELRQYAALLRAQAAAVELVAKRLEADNGKPRRRRARAVTAPAPPAAPYGYKANGEPRKRPAPPAHVPAIARAAKARARAKGRPATTTARLSAQTVGLREREAQQVRDGELAVAGQT